MPFGLTNAPAVFTRLLDHTFFDELRLCVKVFFDDISVFPRTSINIEDQMSSGLIEVGESGCGIRNIRRNSTLYQEDEMYI